LRPAAHYSCLLIAANYRARGAALAVEAARAAGATHVGNAGLIRRAYIFAFRALLRLLAGVCRCIGAAPGTTARSAGYALQAERLALAIDASVGAALASANMLRSAAYVSRTGVGATLRALLALGTARAAA
jgi:hypothetical protein